mmetsp:Transcript_3294/g.7287  ORF Transcript_3294/g.7287 Transcript_3294/m.7287 type:complete len:150 (-) Transcript_3294:103-552(-)
MGIDAHRCLFQGECEDDGGEGWRLQHNQDSYFPNFEQGRGRGGDCVLRFGRVLPSLPQRTIDFKEVGSEGTGHEFDRTRQSRVAASCIAVRVEDDGEQLGICEINVICFVKVGRCLPVNEQRILVEDGVRAQPTILGTCPSSCGILLSF